MEFSVQKSVSLADYNTLKVGGIADYLVEVGSEEEMMKALRFAKQTGAPSLVIGAGSNILFGDDGYRGLVIINKIVGREYVEENSDVVLAVGAGETLDEVVADSVGRGYWGLENLSAIPGTVGATPVQNVGAYGVEVSSLITEVEVINSETLEKKFFSNAECQFAYRDSFFKSDEGKSWVIVKVYFRLKKEMNAQLSYGSLPSLEGKEITPQVVREEIIKIRSEKFPDWHTVGTAGSFFKNPIIDKQQAEELLRKYPTIPTYPVEKDKVKLSLGFVLDKVCGLRGYCQNGVCLYEKQALVLVNFSANDSKTIDEFADHIVHLVQKKVGIKIEREVRKV